MSLNLYDTTIPVIKLYLNNLIHILNIAESSSQQQNVLSSRLASDMYTLIQQVQCACKAAENIPLLVLGEPVTGSRQHDNDEATFEALRARISDTIVFIQGEGVKSFSRDAYDGADKAEVTWQTYKMSGLVYGKSSSTLHPLYVTARRLTERQSHTLRPAEFLLPRCYSI